LAMVGKECVGIAGDLRFGIQAMTLATDKEKVYKINDQCFIGLAGLATDNQTVLEQVRFRTNMYKLREDRDVKPSTLASMIATLLYEHRFGPYFVEPVIAGIEPSGKPYIAAFDLIGAGLFAEDFVLAGSNASEALVGMCESLWKPDMNAQQLFEVISQCLLSAVDRDATSGWGAIVHIIEKDKITTRKLQGRQD